MEQCAGNHVIETVVDKRIDKDGRVEYLLRCTADGWEPLITWEREENIYFKSKLLEFERRMSLGDSDEIEILFDTTEYSLEAERRDLSTLNKNEAIKTQGSVTPTSLLISGENGNTSNLETGKTISQRNLSEAESRDLSALNNNEAATTRVSVTQTSVHISQENGNTSNSETEAKEVTDDAFTILETVTKVPLTPTCSHGFPFSQELLENTNNLKAEDIEMISQRSIFEAKEEAKDAFTAEDYKKCYEIYSSAMTIDPANNVENAKLYYNRSVVNSKLGNTNASISDCSEAIKLDGNYLKAYLWRADLYHQTNRFRECVRDYERVLEIEHTEEYALLLEVAKAFLTSSQWLPQSPRNT